MVTNLKSAKEFFAGDIFATEVTGIEIIEASDGHSKVQLEVGPQHRNAGGVVMGGVYFTMADFAFAVAANCNRPLTVTLSSNINFVAPAKGTTLYAEANCTHDGSKTCIYDVRVYDELGTTIALLTSTGFRKKEQ